MPASTRLHACIYTHALHIQQGEWRETRECKTCPAVIIQVLVAPVSPPVMPLKRRWPIGLNLPCSMHPM